MYRLFLWAKGRVMDLSVVVGLLGLVVAVLSLVATMAMFVLGNIRRDNAALRDEIQNLFRIKSGISGELSAFKQEAAKEFVTYPRMSHALEQHTRALNESVARIESDLKVLPQLQMLIAGIAARMNIDVSLERK